MTSFEGIEVLIATVEAGSFTAAARKLGVTASAVSRRVARLEEELGVQLLARTTRTLRLTDDGRAFHDRCVRIVEELDEAKAALARARRKPAGVLRVDAATAIAHYVLAPRLPELLERYPELELHLTARDQKVDPIAEGIDVLLRIGHLESSNLIAKRLGTSEILFVASPSYLARRGAPNHPRDLAEHDVVGYLRDGRPAPWLFSDTSGVYEVPIRGNFHANDITALRMSTLGGRGMTAAFDFIVAEDLRAGRLVRVLEHAPSTTWPIHALYAPNRHLLPKVRVFLEFAAKVFAPTRRRK
jgi:LysR family transcriptional regulator for bpeEF and oprC